MSGSVSLWSGIGSAGLEVLILPLWIIMAVLVAFFLHVNRPSVIKSQRK